MKVGLFITNQQTLDTDMVSALDDQFAMVRLARDCGWDSLFSGQHYLNEGNNKQLQTVPLLARLAAEAGEMTIGLGILLLNLHNPVYTADTLTQHGRPALRRPRELAGTRSTPELHRPCTSLRNRRSAA